MRTTLVFAVFLLSLTGQCYGDARKDLTRLHQDFFTWRMSDRPRTATSRGIHKYDDKLESYQMDMYDKRWTKAKELHGRLVAIPMSELKSSDRVNYMILDDMLSTYIRGHQWKTYQNYNPINFMDGIQRNPATFTRAMPFNTLGDFENYIARLEQLPTQYDEFKVLMRESIKLNTTYHRHSLIRVEDQLMSMVVAPVESVFYKPFTDKLNESSVAEKYRSGLQNRGLAAVTNVLTAVGGMWDFLRDEYMPHTRPNIGISSLKDGLAYYEACIHWYLSVNMTADEVHNLGLAEVDRIVGNMQKIMKKQGFSGTVGEYFKKLMNMTEFFFKTSEEVLDEFRHQINGIIDPKLEGFFLDLPGLPVEVRPMPNDGPRGSYSTGSADGSTPGVFWANVIDTSYNPNFTMMSLTMHEANPGHHLQLSYSITSDTPDFRQKMESSPLYKAPFAFPRYTAFVEGWALYAEYLGEEMGVYRDDYELMGRYSSEIFRACRLVVDTGIHAKEWSRQYAIDYFLNYTARSYDSVAVEIDRYITWPGQALSYKIGELKIKELRQKAEQRLGNRFNVKEFHAIALESGTLPLHVLEYLVNEWLDNYSSPETTTPSPTCGVTSSTLSWTMGIVLLLTALSSKTNLL